MLVSPKPWPEIMSGKRGASGSPLVLCLYSVTSYIAGCGFLMAIGISEAEGGVILVL